MALVVSLPRLSAGYVRAIKDELDAGTLGKVTYARVRVAHDGALPTATDPEGWLPSRFFDPDQAGGGALIDLGCHPLYLLRFFLGLPERVAASYGNVTGRAVEDQAVVTLGYAGGALGVAEVGFVGRSPLTIEIHGSRGSLLSGVPDDRLRWRDAEAGNGAGWVVRDELPEDRPSPFAQWVAHVRDGTTAPENVAAAVDLSLLVEAANRSAADGRTVRLDSSGRG